MLSKRTVLVVDDAEAIRTRLSQLVEATAGLQVVATAACLASALDALKAYRPDLVLLDLQLGADSGFDVLAGSRDQNPAPAVWIVTTHSFPQLRELALRRGAAGVFDKATELPALADALREFGAAGAPA